MQVLRQLKQFYWAERKLLYASIFCLMCTTALGLVYPNLLRILIDDVIKKGKYNWVPYLASLVLIVVIIKASFQFLSGLFGGRLGNKLMYNLRNELYKKLQYLSSAYYDEAKTGDIMSRMTSDLDGARQFVGFGFAQLLNTFLMVGFGAVMMFTIEWRLTLISLVTVPFLAITALKLESRIHPAFREISKSMSRLNTVAQENISGVRTVKSFARENFELNKFSQKNDAYKQAFLNMTNVWGTYFPIMELLACLSAVILLGVGGTFVVNDHMTVGELVAFFSLIWYIIGPMWMLGYQINMYTMSKASSERLLEILSAHVHVKDKENAVTLDPNQARGDISFERVTFAYGDKEPALTDFNLSAPAGTIVGLLGGTGSGKTTVIQLLLRAYNVKEGRITFDGTDLQDISVESLRRQIAVVFQETFLFSASIRNNIAYGDRNISMDEVIRAAKLAKAHDFIMELPQGYDTLVGERGLGLSGGQKQRIAIARAILQNPKVLILDDATSAVDMETEHEIQAGFKELMKGRTTFIIAHRISSLKHADEIIVLDGGNVVQRGSHRELLRQPGPYQQTFNIQYSDRPMEAGTETEAGAETEAEPETLGDWRLAH